MRILATKLRKVSTLTQKRIYPLKFTISFHQVFLKAWIFTKFTIASMNFNECQWSHCIQENAL